MKFISKKSFASPILKKKLLFRKCFSVPSLNNLSTDFQVKMDVHPAPKSLPPSSSKKTGQ